MKQHTSVRRTPGRWTAGAPVLTAGLALMLMACGPADDSSGDSGGPVGEATGVYANRVVHDDLVNSTGATEDDWPYFFQPEEALGEPATTVFSVVSLGYDAADADALGGSITLGLGDGDGDVCVVDGEGDDLVVYENAFRTTVDGQSGTNSEVALVEVSEDDDTYYRFPAEIDETNEDRFDPARYTNLAGVTPTDEGGDRFDLADVIAEHPEIGSGFRACYVRLIDGGTAWPDYGNDNADEHNSGADIDAVEALHYAPM